MDTEDFQDRNVKDRSNADKSSSSDTNRSNLKSSDHVPLSAWKTLAILSSIATMIMYTETMLVPSLPNIIQEFSLPYSVSPWVLTTYLIVGAVMTPIISSLAEMHGKKKILLLVMGVYFIGVLAGGFSNNLYSFILARGLQGVGMSMFPIAFGVIREQFPKSKLAIGQGIITSMFASGAIIGLIVGAAISAEYGWKMTFISIVPITILLPILVWRFTPIGAIHSDWKMQHQKPSTVDSTKVSTKSNAQGYRAAPGGSESNTRNKSLDIVGAALLAITISTFLVSLTFIETSGGGMSPMLFGFAAACVVSISAFVWNEKRRTSNPLIDLNLLKNRILLFSNFLIVILGFSMFMVFQTIPILTESPPPAGFGAGTVDAAKIQLPFAVILLIFGPTSGFIVSKLGSVRPTVFGYAINAGGFFLLAAFHSQPWMVSVSLAVISTGISLGSVGLMNIVLLATPFQKMVTSVGMTTLLRIVGSAVGPAIAGVIMQLHQITIPGHLGKFPSSDSYTIIFLSAALVSTLSVVMALRIRHHLQKHNSGTQGFAAETVG